VVDVRVSGSCPRGFDRVVPPVGLVQVGQCPAVPVVRALRRVGDERNPLAEKCRFSVLRCLGTPAANGESGFLRLRGVPNRRIRSRPRTSSTMSTVSPSTTFNTVAVVGTGSACAVGGELTRRADITVAAPQTTNRRINAPVLRCEATATRANVTVWPRRRGRSSSRRRWRFGCGCRDRPRTGLSPLVDSCLAAPRNLGETSTSSSRTDTCPQMLVVTRPRR
jgi:hypothetical protein